jgi:hypothetical protein
MQSRRLDIARALGLARMAVGATAWLAPRQAARSFGLGEIAGEPAAALLSRLFGIRDLAVGGALLVAEDHPARRRALEIGVVCDVADAAAALIALRSGMNARAALLAGGVALAATAVGIALLRAGEGWEAPRAVDDVGNFEALDAQRAEAG